MRGELPDAEFAKLMLHEVPQRVAAICIRDHWEDLDDPAREWCVGTLAEEIAKTSNDADFVDPIPGNPFVGSIMLANGFAAYVLPKVIASDPDNTVALDALANSVTHSSEQAVFNASQGIAKYFKVANPDLMLRCVAAISMRARLLSERAGPRNAPNIESYTSPRSRWTALTKLQHIVSSISSFLRGRVQESTPEQPSVSVLVRAKLLEGSIDPEAELTKLDLASWHGTMALRSILEILTGVPNSPLAQEFFGRVAYSIVEDSASDDDNEMSFRREHDTVSSLAKFVLLLPFNDAKRCYQPLLDAIDEQPDEVASFMESLVLMADQAYPQATCFWDIWSDVTTRILKTPWLNRVNSPRSMGVKLVNNILLNRPWKEDIRHWRGLDGHEKEISELVPLLPATSPVLEAYLRFLYRIGERSLPMSFAVVATILKNVAQPKTLLDSANTVFYLEMTLQR